MLVTPMRFFTANKNFGPNSRGQRMFDVIAKCVALSRPTGSPMLLAPEQRRLVSSLNPPS